MSNPLVSVIITNYNYGKYVGDAIKSALFQTYKPIEIIIVDDGSTDNSKVVIKPFLQNENVHFIKQNNQGQAKAKNKGSRLAKGNYVAFLDGDDVWVEDKLEKQMNLFSRSKIGVVYSDIMLINEEGQTVPSGYQKKYP